MPTFLCAKCTHKLWIHFVRLEVALMLDLELQNNHFRSLLWAKRVLAQFVSNLP